MKPELTPDPHEPHCSQLCTTEEAEHASVQNFGIHVGHVHYIVGTSKNPAVDEIAIKVTSSSPNSNDQAYITFRSGADHLDPRVVDHTSHRTAYLYYPMSMLRTIEQLLVNRLNRPVAIYVQFFNNGSHVWASIEAAGF